MTARPLALSRLAALCLAFCLLGPAACRHGAASSVAGKSPIKLYAAMVNDQVKKHWRFSEKSAGESRVAVVGVWLEEDGRISRFELAQSSGNAGYDASCIKAVAETGQLPPPPASISLLQINFNSMDSGR